MSSEAAVHALPPPIAVTGATGTVGRALVERLRAGGVPVRAIARGARATFAGRPGIEAVACDLHDAAAAGRAFSGCAALFLLTPLEPDMPRVGARLVEAACAAGVSRIVRLSAFGAGDARPNRLGTVHRAVEEVVEALAPEWTILRPNSFMQNFAVYAGHTIRAEGVFHMPQGDGAVSVIDARDIAAAAEHVLLEPGHAGARYELTGPAALANAAAAAILSTVLGRTVRYRDVTQASARDSMLGAGMSPWLVEVIMELYAMSKAGQASRIDPAAARLLGRPPVSFETYVRECREAFA